MTINTSWKVEIGLLASKTNFTSRVMSMNIDQSVDVNVVGRGQCTITLLNEDGALTPGGGGTYTSADWFAMGVFVTALTNTGGSDTETVVFHGVVTDFDLVDNGVFSTVTITALDGLTIVGKTAVLTDIPLSGSTDYGSLMLVAIGDARYQLNYLKLGKSTAIGVYNDLTVDGPFLGYAVLTNVYALNQSYSTYADLLQTTVVPSVNDVVYATKILVNGTRADYYLNITPVTMTPSSTNRNDFEFDPSASLSGSKLPFDIEGFTQSFNNDELMTQVNIKGNFPSATTSNAVSGDIGTYGNRNVQYTNTFVFNQTASDAMANNLINRFSNVKFVPASLGISAKQVKAYAADAAHSKWYKLLGIETGLWQKCKITWTGSGAASQTKYSIIKGRSINVTPDNTYVSLRLADWVNNHSFILDTDQLDTDRLG